jgi:transketolase
LIPYGATFLIFSDYMRPPLRLASIMKIRQIMVFTHDSIGLGEDGTTHQPVEQLIGLRSVPNMTVIRPADANETAHAWRVAIEHTDGPVALALTRQELPVIDQKKFASAENLEKGAYILSDSEGQPDVILMASGSEVQLILKGQEELKKNNISARVVSMPSWNLFDQQNDEYKEKVFPKAIRTRLAVEAGSTIGWMKYTTDGGDVIGIDRFGESAPADELFKEFGFTVENVVKKATALVSGNK